MMYPPSILTIEYFTLGDLVSTMGGYFSVIKMLTILIVSYFIFNELTRSMANRIFTRANPEYEGTKEERNEEIERIQSKFRERVSQQGIYDLHEAVDKIQNGERPQDKGQKLVDIGRLEVLEESNHELSATNSR